MLKKYFSPAGRLSRGGYWLYGVLIPILLSAPAIVLFAIGSITEEVFDLLDLGLNLLFLWPLYIALPIKRIHDLGRSGWFYLLFLLVSIPIMFVIFMGVGVEQLSAFAEMDEETLGVALLDFGNYASPSLLVGGLVAFAIYIIASFIIFMVLPGQAFENKYGPDPREE